MPCILYFRHTKLFSPTSIEEFSLNLKREGYTGCFESVRRFENTSKSYLFTFECYQTDMNPRAFTLFHNF